MKPLEALKIAVRQWAVIMAEMFYWPVENLQPELKPGDSTPLTPIDREGAKYLQSTVLGLIPGCTFKDEETEVSLGISTIRVDTDNADGSRNIGRLKVPQTLTGGVLTQGKEFIGAVIGNPFEDKLIFGAPGIGVFRSKLKLGIGEIEQPEPLQLSPHGLDPKVRYFGIDSFGPPKVKSYKSRFIELAWSRAWNMCSYGSNIYYTQLLLEGRIDFYLTDCIGSRPDIMCGMALIPLLGGTVLGPDGFSPDFDEQRYVLATNGENDRDLLMISQGAYPPDFRGFKG